MSVERQERHGDRPSLGEVAAHADTDRRHLQVPLGVYYGHGTSEDPVVKRGTSTPEASLIRRETRIRDRTRKRRRNRGHPLTDAGLLGLRLPARLHVYTPGRGQ